MSYNKRNKCIKEGLGCINKITLSVIGETNAYKETPIENDFSISENVLGFGVSGKVYKCTKKQKDDKNTSDTYALKVLNDSEKARREINIHWMASHCPNIVSVKDVYENKYKNKKCLLMIMECMEGGELFGRINEARNKL